MNQQPQTPRKTLAHNTNLKQNPQKVYFNTKTFPAPYEYSRRGRAGTERLFYNLFTCFRSY